MEEVLDNPFLEKKEEPLLQVLKWWEQKRLLFALIIVAAQVIIMFMLRDETVRFGIKNAIFGSLAYIVVANLFYCVGWGIEFLMIYYLKIGTANSAGRTVFLFLGIIFSLFLTLSMYVSALSGF